MNIQNILNSDFHKFFILLSHIQLQLVALVFLVILEITYFHRRKLPILSTWCFSAMMIFSLVFVLLDTAAIIEKNVPFYRFWQGRLISQLRIYAFLSVTLSIYLYVSLILGKKQSLSKKEKIKILGIYGFAILVIFLAQIRVKNDENGFYSYRIMNLFVNACSLAFASMTIIDTVNYSIRNPKAFFKGKRKYLFWTTAIWIFMSFFQMFVPLSSISSIAITAMSFIMYLGLETPGDFLDRETNALNGTALHLVLQNLTSNKKNFFIMNIDVEDFSQIEEKFGEDIANQIIANIGDFITQQCLCPIFRSEQNSITILVKETKKTNSTYCIDEMIGKIKNRMEDYWQIGDNKFLVSSHCDFIYYPADVPENLSMHELTKLIDNWHSYSDQKGFVRQADAQLLQKRNREIKIIQLVTDAIANDGIEMYYQPIYEIQADRFSNFEALVRLKDTTTIGFVSPEEFIPIAEKNGLIMKLSDKIFNLVFSFVSQKKLEEKGISHIEVNLSGLQSVDAALPNQMTELLKKYNLNPNIVNLEITESIAITSSFMLKKNMDQLKKIGCTFSMDDFGTGYSNLSQIANVDYELIKIDKSLLWPCFDEKNPNCKNARVILENMINMILKLGKKIVVEGVETKEQFEYLKKMGVTYIQGYYFSKPLPEEKYMEFINEKI